MLTLLLTWQDEQAAVMDRLVWEPKPADLLNSMQVKQVSLFRHAYCAVYTTKDALESCRYCWKILCCAQYLSCHTYFTPKFSTSIGVGLCDSAVSLFDTATCKMVTDCCTKSMLHSIGKLPMLQARIGACPACWSSQLCSHNAVVCLWQPILRTIQQNIPFKVSLNLGTFSVVGRRCSQINSMHVAWIFNLILSWQITASICFWGQYNLPSAHRITACSMQVAGGLDHTLVFQQTTAKCMLLGTSQPAICSQSCSMQVACGLDHTLVLTDHGQAYAFGDNSLCQLGRKGSMSSAEADTDPKGWLIKDEDGNDVTFAKVSCYYHTEYCCCCCYYYCCHVHCYCCCYQ